MNELEGCGKYGTTASLRWRDGHACTTSILRIILTGAYTEVDSPLLGVRGADSCFLGDLNQLKVPGYKIVVCIRARPNDGWKTTKGGLTEAWKK